MENTLPDVELPSKEAIAEAEAVIERYVTKK